MGGGGEAVGEGRGEEDSDVDGRSRVDGHVLHDVAGRGYSILVWLLAADEVGERFGHRLLKEY